MLSLLAIELELVKELEFGGFGERVCEGKSKKEANCLR